MAKIRDLLKLSPAIAATSEDVAEGNLSDATTATLLEQHLVETKDADPAAVAAEALAEFRMSPGAKHLLDRAVDDLSKQTGAAMPDADARVEIRNRAGLIDACGNDISVVLDVLGETVEPTRLPGVVYSTLYAVLKQAVFIANLDYRRYLDPKQDFDLRAYMGPVVARGENGEDHRELDGHLAHTDRRSETSPLEGQSGHYDAIDWQMETLRSLYGRNCESEDDVIICALSDMRLFFQLNCEAVGWDPAMVMPYGNIAEKDGTYTPLTSAIAALDHQQVKAQLSRAKKRLETNQMLIVAQERARAIRAALRK